MTNLYALSEGQLLLFALILMRMTAFVVSSAIFGSPTVSAHLKVLFSLMLSVLLFPIVKAGNVNYLVISDQIILLVARELLIGLTLGFLTRLFFFTVTMTGDLVSITVGLNASQMYNPLLGANGNTMDQFYSVLGTLVFLAVNGHHLLLSALAQSFDMVPVASMNLNWGVFGEMATFGQATLLIAIKMSAPMIVAIFVTNLSMGILGRAVPQMNVLVTSMPVTILLGMSVVFLCLPLFVLEMNGVLDITATKLFMVMKHL
jgi:flagellar biosynthetic protein FliR